MGHIGSVFLNKMSTHVNNIIVQIGTLKSLEIK